MDNLPFRTECFKCEAPKADNAPLIPAPPREERPRGSGYDRGGGAGFDRRGSFNRERRSDGPPEVRPVRLMLLHLVCPRSLSAGRLVVLVRLQQLREQKRVSPVRQRTLVKCGDNVTRRGESGFAAQM